LNTISEKIKL